MLVPVDYKKFQEKLNALGPEHPYTEATCALQKRRYVYLMVRNPADQKQILWVKEDGVIDQITNVLHCFAMPDSLLTEVQAYIKQSEAADKALAQASLKDLREEQKQLTSKLSRMADLLIDGSIDKSIYDAKQREIIFRKAEIDQRLQQVDSPQQDAPDTLSKLVEMTARSAEIFASSNGRKTADAGICVFEPGAGRGKPQIFLAETLRPPAASTEKSRMACRRGSIYEMGDVVSNPPLKTQGWP